MAKREVLMLGHPLLRKISTDIDAFNNDLDIIITDLKDTLLHLQETKKIGRALAAPQIGYNQRVIYANLMNREIIMVNPTVIYQSDETIEVWDSCYSFDVSFFVKIRRAKNIKVKYLNENKNVIIEEFSDDLSELFQHEIDHLDGKLATDYISDNTKILMRGEWEKRYRVL